MKHILLLLLILLIGSCASDSGLYKKSTTIDNQIASSPPAPWKSISSEGSDFALQNNKTKSLFLLNSACRKNDSSSLDSLVSSILTGLEDVTFIENKVVTYQERQAVEVVASGKLDGVIRFFKIVTIIKNNCIYDYVLISTNVKNLDKDSPDLKTFLKRIILN